MYPRWLLAGCIVLVAQADGEPGVDACGRWRKGWVEGRAVCAVPVTLQRIMMPGQRNSLPPQSAVQVCFSMFLSSPGKTV